MLLVPAGSSVSGFKGWQCQDEGPWLPLAGYSTSAPDPGLRRGARVGLTPGAVVTFRGRNETSPGLSAQGYSGRQIWMK